MPVTGPKRRVAIAPSIPSLSWSPLAMTQVMEGVEKSAEKYSEGLTSRGILLQADMQKLADLDDALGRMTKARAKLMSAVVEHFKAKREIQPGRYVVTPLPASSKRSVGWKAQALGFAALLAAKRLLAGPLGALNGKPWDEKVSAKLISEKYGTVSSKVKLAILDTTAPLTEAAEEEEDD